MVEMGLPLYGDWNDGTGTGWHKGGTAIGWRWEWNCQWAAKAMGRALDGGGGGPALDGDARGTASYLGTVRQVPQVPISRKEDS